MVDRSQSFPFLISSISAILTTDCHSAALFILPWINMITFRLHNKTTLILWNWSRLYCSVLVNSWFLQYLLLVSPCNKKWNQFIFSPWIFMKARMIFCSSQTASVSHRTAHYLSILVLKLCKFLAVEISAVIKLFCAKRAAGPTSMW